MKILSIDKFCISDGPGIRVSVYCSGCEFHCQGCHNPESWNFNQGDELTDDIIIDICNQLSNPYYQGITFCGGEPLHEINRSGFLKIAKAIREKCPDKNIWCYTGFEWDDVKDFEIMQYIDVIVVGRFILSERDISDDNRWRGSRNQRVVDVKKSLLSQKQINLVDIPNNL